MFHTDHCKHSYHVKANLSYGSLCNSGYMELLASRIKRLRTSMEISQQDLATSVGVSRVAVTKWENGDTENLKLANLKKLAGVFKITIADLIDAKENLIQEPTAPYPVQESPGVTALPKRDDPLITEVVSLMLATDATGRAIAASHVKLALSQYQPALSKTAT